MTVCTPHEYAGPRKCPYCALEAAKALIGRVKRTLDEAPRYDPDAKEPDYGGIGAALACLAHARELLEGQP